MRSPLLGALALMTLPGCSAVVGDLGSFSENAAACRMDGHRNEIRDFRFALRNMGAHTNHYVDILVTERGSNQLRSRFILDPLGGAAYDLSFENAVPPGDALDVQFYADTNANRMIDNPTSVDDVSRDHTWVRPVCSDASQYFEHIFEFQPIVDVNLIGAGYELHLSNIPAELTDLLLETRLVFTGGGPEDGRTVGVYRKRPTTPASDAADMVIPGIVDLGNEYVALWYFDVDGDETPSEGDLFCGRRDNAPSDGADPQPLVFDLDMMAEMSAGHCELTGLNHAEVPEL